MPTADVMLPAFMWHKSCVLIYSYASDFIVARFMFNGSNLAYFRTISKQIICAITQQIEHTIIMILIYSRLSRQYMRFHNLKHPSDMGAEQVKSFLPQNALRGVVHEAGRVTGARHAGERTPN
jgi:hypothetical protein